MGILDFGKKEPMAPLADHLAARKPALELDNMLADKLAKTPPAKPADAEHLHPAPVDAPQDVPQDVPQAGGGVVVVENLDKKINKLGRKIQTSKKRLVREVLAIGEMICEVRDLLAGYPSARYGKWMKKFGISRTSAFRYSQAWETFGEKCSTVEQLFDMQSVRLLSAARSPQPAIDEAIELADDGQHVDAQVAKQLIAKHTVAKPKKKRIEPVVISTEFGSVAIHCKPGASERDLVAAVLKQLLDGERKVA